MEWLIIYRPNSKNLIRVLNLRRGSNMVGSTRNCIQCFEIRAGAQLEPVFGGSATRGLKFIKFDLRRTKCFEFIICKLFN